MEKLAEVLYALNPDRQAWDGDTFGFQEALRRGEYNAARAVKQAELLIALAVVDATRCGELPTMWELQRLGTAPR